MVSTHSHATFECYGAVQEWSEDLSGIVTVWISMISMVQMTSNDCEMFADVTTVQYVLPKALSSSSVIKIPPFLAASGSCGKGIACTVSGILGY